MILCGLLESGHTLTGIVGSNPTLSAITFVRLLWWPTHWRCLFREKISTGILWVTTVSSVAVFFTNALR